MNVVHGWYKIDKKLHSTSCNVLPLDSLAPRGRGRSDYHQWQPRGGYINLEDTTQRGHIKEAAIVVQEDHCHHIITGAWHAGTRLKDGHINANN